MARGLDEVKTSVHAIVNQFLSIHTVLLLEVCVEACLNVFNNRLPAVEGRISFYSVNGTNRRLDGSSTCCHCSQSLRSLGCRPLLSAAARRFPQCLR